MEFKGIQTVRKVVLGNHDWEIEPSLSHLSAFRQLKKQWESSMSINKLIFLELTGSNII